MIEAVIGWTVLAALFLALGAAFVVPAWRLLESTGALPRHRRRWLAPVIGGAALCLWVCLPQAVAFAYRWLAP